MRIPGLALVLTAILACIATLVAVIVVAGLMGHEKKIRYEIEPRYTVRDEQFVRSMGSLLPPPMHSGNTVRTLVNGREIFPAMLDAIRSAQGTVCLETFILWPGRVGRMFVDALAERARAGIAVHLLIDWLGSKAIDRRYIDGPQSCRGSRGTLPPVALVQRVAGESPHASQIVDCRWAHRVHGRRGHRRRMGRRRG